MQPDKHGEPVTVFNWSVTKPDGGSTAEQARAFLQVTGGQLECAAWGNAPGDSIALVLLHEGLGCVDLWRGFPSSLAQASGCGVFAYSRFGYGRSDACSLPRPLDYMTREATDVLPEVLDATGIKRCVLVGHSDGATISAINAGSVQDHRVRGVVLIAPHFFTEPFAQQSIREAKEQYDNADLKARLAKYHSNADVAFRGWNDAWLDPEFETDWDVSDVIEYIRVPVLAIQGEDDQYGSRAQIDVLEQRLYSPIDVQMIADCKHSPHLEAPEPSCEHIAAFVKRLIRIDHG